MKIGTISCKLQVQLAVVYLSVFFNRQKLQKSCDLFGECRQSGLFGCQGI